MAFFTVAGTTVPVAEGSVSRAFGEIGDRARTFDGTLRETIRSRVSEWKGETVPVSWATATSILNKLNASTQPQNCTGTMFSSSGTTTLTLFTRAVSVKPIQSGTDEYFVVSWEAEESS